jgi:hypothetical protein
MVLNRSVSDTDRDSGQGRPRDDCHCEMMLVVLVARNPQVYLNSLIGDTGPCEYSSSTVKPHISTPAFCGREVWRTGTPVEPPRAWPLGCRSVLGLVRHTTLKDSQQVVWSHALIIDGRTSRPRTTNGLHAPRPHGATGQPPGRPPGQATGHGARKRREPTTRPWWLFTCVASASMGSGTSCATPPSRRS